MLISDASVCIIGAGTMGRGIAQVAVAAGHRVALVDPLPGQRASAMAEVSARLARRDPAIASTLSERLTVAPDVADVADVWLAAEAKDISPSYGPVVIEAVLEDLDVKISVLGRALEHLGGNAILATNTSSLSVTQIAARLEDPSRVVGMHFFNPVPVMKLVEVVSGLQTDPQVADHIADLARHWGKGVARVRSAPGFIVNRVARAFYAEALRLVEEQAAPTHVIDAVFRGAGRFRMGPFELMDLIGNDVNAAVTRSVWTSFNYDPRFEPSRLQDELVAAGRFGRKSGHGFYSYVDGGGVPEAMPSLAGPPPTRLVAGELAPQLEALVRRSGITVERVAMKGDDLLLPDGTHVRLTRGRTARAESMALEGVPVVLLDRCLNPDQASAIAVSGTHRNATDAVVGLLGRAGIAGYVIDDVPGLLLARTLAVIANEAWTAVLHGVATRDDVDTAMRLGTNYPAGPFEWSTEWGPAGLLETLDELWDAYHDTRYRAAVNLRSAALAP